MELLDRKPIQGGIALAVIVGILSIPGGYVQDANIAFDHRQIIVWIKDVLNDTARS